jgi:hypothetical protein
MARNHLSAWFQLVKMRLTISKLLIANDRNFDHKCLIEPPGWVLLRRRVSYRHERLRGVRSVRPAVLMPDT